MAPSIFLELTISPISTMSRKYVTIVAKIPIVIARMTTMAQSREEPSTLLLPEQRCSLTYLAPRATMECSVH